MFILLSGYPPFNGKNDKEILEKVKAGDFKFKASIWKSISQEAKDLIISMLDFNLEKRPSADIALTHDWFTSVSTCRNLLDEGVMMRLGNFTV